MMLQLLVLYVSRPALFLSSVAIANDIGLVQTCNSKCVRQRIVNFRNLDRELSRSLMPIATRLRVVGQPSVSAIATSSISAAFTAWVTGPQARGAQGRIAAQFAKSATMPQRRGARAAYR
jgi:hypothetical protein